MANSLPQSAEEPGLRQSLRAVSLSAVVDGGVGRCEVVLMKNIVLIVVLILILDR